MIEELITEKETVKTAIFSEEAARLKFDHVAKYYFWIMGFLEIKPNLQAIELADIKKGECLLDIGFGTGWCLERLVPLVGQEHVTYGLDFSEGMKEVTLENLRKKGLDKSVSLHNANVKDMPFEDNKFDLVFISFVIDLLEKKDIPIALREIKRVLKPSGRVIIFSMTKEGKNIFKIARYLYEWMYHKWPTILGYKPSCRPIYIENIVMKAGFEIAKYRLTYISGFLFPIAIILARPKLKEGKK